MDSKSTRPLQDTYHQRQTISYHTPTCYSCNVLQYRDRELTQDDAYDDDRLGNEVFCRDYDMTAH